MARARHLDALGRAAGHLTAARESAAQLELFAEELRLATGGVVEITGEFTAEICWVKSSARSALASRHLPGLLPECAALMLEPCSLIQDGQSC